MREARGRGSGDDVRVPARVTAPDDAPGGGGPEGADRAPRRVGFLLVDGFPLMSYAAAVEPLRAANLLAGKTLYALEQIPVAGGRARSSVGATVGATTHVGERVDFDLVLVVAGGDPLAFDGAGTLTWLRQLDRRGVALGGVSGGPAILARAGVMGGRRMTVHWDHLDAVRDAWPTLLVERQIYVMDRDRLTAAGGTAALDMAHALVAEHHGHRFARRVSDWFVHTDVRDSEEPQRAGPAERHGTHHPVLLQAIGIMENHLGDPLTLEQLARVCGIGVRQMNRLFTAKLGLSTIAYYRELRLATAHGLLGRSALSIGEIAEATGFASAAHFSRRFRARYGLAPSRARAASVADRAAGPAVGHDAPSGARGGRAPRRPRG